PMFVLIGRTAEPRCGAFVENDRIQLGDLVVRRRGGDPVIEFAGAVPRDLAMDPDRRIDRAFEDRASAQDAVLGIAPRALHILERLSAGSELIEMSFNVEMIILMLLILDDSVVI